MYFGSFRRNGLDLTLAIHPLSAGLPWDQYTARSRGWGTISGAEPGEKQSNWSWEPSVRTLLSLVQLHGQKVKSQSPARVQGGCRAAHWWLLALEEGHSWADLLLWSGGYLIHLEMEGKWINPPASSKVQFCCVCQPYFRGVLKLIPTHFVCGQNWLFGWASLFQVFSLWSSFPEVNQLRIAFFHVAVITLRGGSQVAVGDAVPQGHIWEDFLLLKPQGQHKAL